MLRVRCVRSCAPMRMNNGPRAPEKEARTETGKKSCLCPEKEICPRHAVQPPWQPSGSRPTARRAPPHWWSRARRAQGRGIAAGQRSGPRQGAEPKRARSPRQGGARTAKERAPKAQQRGCAMQRDAWAEGGGLRRSLPLTCECWRRAPTRGRRARHHQPCGPLRGDGRCPGPQRAPRPRTRTRPLRGRSPPWPRQR